jgi:hypothetical protein
MEDITGAKIVEVSIRDDGKVIWINVDGKCALRVCAIENIVMDDRRPVMKTKEEIAEEFLLKPIGAVFPDAPEKIRNGICPTCDESVGEFRDNLSRREYEISGTCQKCQDRIFKPR